MMQMNLMMQINFKKRISLLFILLFVGAAFMVHLVYTGHIIPNKIFIRDSSVIGCDVSHYQGTIDWAILKEQGVQFAYIKATEGSSHTDPLFQENWSGTAASDLSAGAYHFFSFESPGQTQAKHFCRTVEKRPGMLPPAVDVEFYGNFEQQKPDAQAVRKELDEFLEFAEQIYGTKPILYVTKESYDYFIKGYYEEYPLWIRSVLTYPLIDQDWVLWQYTNREQLKGYSGTEKYIDR